MLLINACLSPHWYFLLSLFIFVLYFIASIFKAVKIGKAKLRTQVETSVAAVVCKDNYGH